MGTPGKNEIYFSTYPYGSDDEANGPRNRALSHSRAAFWAAYGEGRIVASDLETNIQWYRGEENAVVYSSDPAVIRRLERNKSTKVIETHRDGEGAVTGMDFEVPVALISIRSGRRKVSQAQREAGRRLGEARKRKSLAGAAN